MEKELYNFKSYQTNKNGLLNNKDIKKPDDFVKIHSKFNEQENSNQFLNTLNSLKAKCIELYYNENFWNCINPFRHDTDPTERYCYYCLSLTCCLIWIIIFIFATHSS